MLDTLEPRLQFATTGLDPTYGDGGVARVAVAETGTTQAVSTQINAAAFAASGAGYVQVRQQYPAEGGLEQDYQDRYLLYHVNADGTFDHGFGTGGRFETKAPGDPLFFQTFAVAPTGRAVASDTRHQYHVFDANGREQFGVSNRLTRTINRLRDAGDYYDLGKIDFSETAAFDGEGRLLMLGEYRGKAKQNAVAVFRFTTYGLLDHSFGTTGRAFTRYGYDGINYASTRLAVGRDGQIGFTGSAFPDFSPPADGNSYYSAAELHYATFSRDGTLVGSGVSLKPDVAVSTSPLGGSGNLDLRPLADGTLASLGESASTTRLTALRQDGTVASRPLDGEPQTPVQITPAGTLRGWVGPTKHDPYRPVEGGTDAFVRPDPNSVNRLAVLGDGSLIAAGTDRTTATPTLLVQKFDGTGLADAAGPGLATLQPQTRTLDVRGTDGDDAITITAADGLLRVRTNNASQEFRFSDFDTLHVAGGGGNDTIAVTLGRTNVAVRLRGDAGDDVLTTDAYQATIDGGDGQDAATLTPGADLNPVSIETLRHPDRHA